MPLVSCRSSFTSISEAPVPLWVTVPMHLAAFSVLALLCHRRAGQKSSGVQHLTEFYLWLAQAVCWAAFSIRSSRPRSSRRSRSTDCDRGRLSLVCVDRAVSAALANPRTLLRPALAAGLAVALLIAGRLGGVARLPMMAILGAPAIVVFGVKRDAARFALGIVGLLAALAVGTAFVPARGERVVYADRTFFGVYRVLTNPSLNLVSLIHGTTTHGRQVIGATSPEP